MIRLEHILRTEANSLKSKKEERMVVVLELKREDEALCRSVCIPIKEYRYTDSDMNLR